MNPALIHRAAAILGDPISGEFAGTMADAVDTMTAYAYGELQDHPNGKAQTRLTGVLRASNPDRVAEVCAAALLRLAVGATQLAADRAPAQRNPKRPILEGP